MSEPEEQYLLTSSMSQCDKSDHRVVMVGPRVKLEELAKHFGVATWTITENGGRTALDGCIRIQRVRTWR